MTGNKPGRPFGVTLAIFVSVIIYSVIPLLQIGMILLVEQHFRNLNSTPLLLPDGSTTEQGVVGGDFRGDLATNQIILQGVLALAFLVVAYFAWRGRPKQMRFIFIGSVLLLTALTLGLTVIPTLLEGTSGSGLSLSFDSGGTLDALSIPLLCLQFVSSVLVPLYVIWYLNRAPARAFYRGYYLEESEV